jgi:hypothetical protein
MRRFSKYLPPKLRRLKVKRPADRTPTRPKRKDISQDDGPICLMFSGLLSHPNDCAFAGVECALRTYGVQPIRFSWGGPEQPWDPTDTIEDDMPWLYRLAECHLEMRPNAQKIVLIAHSAGGILLSETFRHLGNRVVGAFGFAAILGVDEGAPSIPLPGSDEAFDLIDFTGSPIHLAASGLPIHCVIGENDTDLTEEENDLWDITKYGGNIRLTTIPKADHLCVTHDPRALLELETFLGALQL